jgi:hypothetical protein
MALAVGAVALARSAGCERPKPEAKAPATPVVFANDHCPIMGTPIDPAKVPEGLTREFKGQKVAFCCAGCPAAWDKLSDAEKEAKLDAVRVHQEP